jgi:hypothetical protein
MVAGFVVDDTYGGRLVSRWAEGPPSRAFLSWKGVKRPKKAPIPIGTFRCSACAFLESYARDEFAPS